MATIHRRFLQFVLLVAISCSGAQCAPPDGISYQGRLSNAGVPVADGVHQVQFKFFSVETGGTAFKTSDTMSVTTIGGLFTTQIKPVFATDLLGKTDVWIETSVRRLTSDPWQVLTPRAKLMSVPFALQAGDLSLPYVGAVTSADPAITITNAGTGPAGVFGGKVGIGTSSPSEQLQVEGNIKVTGAGNALIFPDGSRLETAPVPSAGVPTGVCILSESLVPPAGYVYTGNSFTIQKSWKEKTPMPTARGSAACAVLSNRIYVIGGQDTSYTRFATNEVYDPATDTWTTRASLPTARSGLAAVALNGRIYVMGGHDGTSVLARLDEYDPATNTWTPKANMPTARQLLAAAVVNGKIYAMGGMDSTNAESAKVEEYNPATNTWTTMANLSSARKSFGATVVNNNIYICGGFAPATVLAKAESWAPGSPYWFPLENLPTPRANCAVVAINSIVYTVGGTDGGFATTNNEAYVGYSHSWSVRPPALYPRNSSCGAVVNNKIYIIGGYSDGSVTLSSVEEYDPAATPVRYYIHRKT